MIHSESPNLKTFKRKSLLLLRNLTILNLKGKLRRNGPQRIHHSDQSPGSDQLQRFLPLRISHGEKHSRQSADMIGMVMSKADNVNRVGTPPPFPECNLSPLPAIYQYTFSIVPEHKRGEPPIRQRHHSSRSQQTYIQHSSVSFFYSSSAAARLVPRLGQRIPAALASVSSLGYWAACRCLHNLKELQCLRLFHGHIELLRQTVITVLT